MFEDDASAHYSGDAPESIQYVSLAEHCQFMNEMENQLLTICQQDYLLNETVQLVSNTTHDSKYNEQVSALLQSKVNYHHGRAIQLKIHFLDGQTCDVYVPLSATLLDLKHSIERSISLRLHQTWKEENRKCRKIHWKHVWHKYDLWVDRTQRIHMYYKLSKETNNEEAIDLSGKMADTSIRKQSILEFIPKRAP